ncbi:GntR family transcriptional regulator [Pseudooceanicola sediminis]|uniref:GntR family transcriptional regulator n=1 Tax=Pseudooceanicola sediminis TaxID=2211117 RepID=A0A399IY35_9RHOB|nr:GntR family transcriptional regulator [Pseudooceanicola sediminis]KAA2314985.1 GntR family transcriptional regulator [Puniceibacterium sp. HSS470]RII37357.1 GntR family transcriptional regulator [Pseudooceanicola sediminis]|tara:strand:- start:40231 stop:40911 length:681 start_codon:yes stop_codon:yes gene_type:complete
MFSRKSHATDRASDTVVSVLACALRRDISFGDLPPDAKLKIEALRARYGGSNHSVREALTLLAAEGLVEATAQRGFRVASATEADLRDIIRLRAELEPMGLRWSMHHADVAWEGRVIAAQHAAARATDQLLGDPDGAVLVWDEAGRTLHNVLCSASGSPRMIRMLGQLYDQSRRFRLAALREGSCDPKAVLAHQSDMVEAILDHDTEGAVRALLSDIRHDLGGQDL